jgi:hypothetical protein
MKYLLIVIGLVLGHPSLLPAQKTRTFRIYPGEKLVDKIPPEDLYSLPAFAKGTILFRNNTYAEATMNLNELFDEMQYVDHFGDTLSLADEKLINSIIIGADTFYYENCYLRHLYATGGIKLARKSFFVFMNRQKLVGYGEASAGSVETFTSVSGKNFLKELVAREIMTLRKDQSLYIGDGYNHFKELNRKNLLEMYATREREVSAYLKENKTDLKDAEAVKQLMIHFSASE